MGQEIISYHSIKYWLWGPLSILFLGYGGFSARIKWPGREFDHSPPSRAEVKNEWIYTSAPPCATMAWTGINVAFTKLTSYYARWFRRWLIDSDFSSWNFVCIFRRLM